MADTAIEWTDKVWNPTTGCDKVSPGCDHCYALTLARRLKGMGSAKYQRDGNPATSGPGFGVSVHPKALDAPLTWTKPARIFVNSMSDLFHAEVPDDFIAQVFAVMALAPQHTFQLLTKRHGRMRSLLNRPEFYRSVRQVLAADHGVSEVEAFGTERFPLHNVWLGVSVEDQKRADLRLDALADTPAAVRFISCEPLLGPLDLTAWLPQPDWSSTTPLDGTLHLLTQLGRCDTQPTDWGWRHEVAKCRQCTNGRRISWLIVGGESGAGARPMDLKWVRSLRDQCEASGVSFFYKQQGSGDGGSKHRRELDGRTWDEYPAVAS